LATTSSAPLVTPARIPGWRLARRFIPLRVDTGAGPATQPGQRCGSPARGYCRYFVTLGRGQYELLFWIGLLMVIVPIAARLLA
jgi:hypothetical protein